jgi:CDP-glycerol glycerophosphotransferase (TagB/SpsB family)
MSKTYKTNDIQNKIQNYNHRTINDVFKNKICYKLAVFVDAIFTGYAHKQGKLINGVELIANKNLKTMFRNGGSNFWFSKDQNKMTDYIVCVNDYQRKCFEKNGIKARLFVLGSPRFEQYANNGKETLNVELLEKINKYPKNKIVLWLPTHTNASSVFYFTNFISSIQNEYTIILKPHPYLYGEIKNFNDYIYSKMPNITILNSVNNVDILPFADFVICDYGGSVFTAIRADRNVIFFNATRDILAKTSFGLDIPEISLRDKIVNFNCDQQDQFISTLHDPTIWEKQKVVRQEIRNEYFKDNPHAALDIADLFRKIAKNEF